MPQDQRPQTAGHLSVLAEGEIEVLGRMPWSSNRTFLVKCSLDGEEMGAVYKPLRGERRLWDFPEGLYKREIAAYTLSEALGWGLVPETIERADAPYGIGSLQRFVPADLSAHHFTLVEDEVNHDRLRAICTFDIVANNTDRKSGHCLLGEDGTIWAIDNALCFHQEPKLRTVIWEFAGEAVSEPLRDGLSLIAAHAPVELSQWLSAQEVRAVADRARRLLGAGRLPEPEPTYHSFPWPLV